MIYPVKKVYVTQKWGVNEETYKRFGFKGHNGVDFRLFDTDGNRASTALVFAPHDGTVKERRFDADGYGNYLKIESEFEGSILGHLKEFKVNINKQVKEGELIGIADNTGWSTGSHLHWGYYSKPRDRSNGYGGTVDPTSYIKPAETMPTKLLEHMGVKDEKEGMEVWDKEQGFLKSEREKTDLLQEDLTTCKETKGVIADNLQSAKDNSEKFVNGLIYLLNPDPTQYKDVSKPDMVEIEIKNMIAKESKRDETERKLQQAIDDAKAAKQDEIKDLKDEIEDLKRKLNNVSDRVDDVEKETEVVVEATPRFKRFTNWLLNIFKRS